MRLELRRLSAALPAAVVLAASAPPARAAAPETSLDAADAVEAAPWLRVDETPERVMRLQVAVRRYEPVDGEGPSVLLARAVHIGGRAFYEQLQSLLDDQDLVLFEGIQPAGVERSVAVTDEERVRRTEARLRLLAIVLARVDEQPTSLVELAAAVEDSAQLRGFVEAARVDAWGRPIRVIVEEDAIVDLESVGADGVPGGEGVNADLRFSAQEPLTSAEQGESRGLQSRLATALGLRFQLDEMDEDGERWRNADMTMSELRDRLAARGFESGDLFGMLEGTGLPARILGFFLGLVERVPGVQPRVKMMLIEMLAAADTDVMAAGLEGGEGFVAVIIDERNQVVVDVLRKVLAEADPDVDEIGIVYGAGHMEDLAERLAEQLGYAAVDESWLSAISLDLERAGISSIERRMYRSQIRAQLRMMERAAEAP